MKNTCENCKHWIAGWGNPLIKDSGKCEVLSDSPDVYDNNSEVGVHYYIDDIDDMDDEIEFRTGKNFGCIHFEQA